MANGYPYTAKAKRKTTLTHILSKAGDQPTSMEIKKGEELTITWANETFGNVLYPVGEETYSGRLSVKDFDPPKPPQ